MMLSRLFHIIGNVLILDIVAQKIIIHPQHDILRARTFYARHYHVMPVAVADHDIVKIIRFPFAVVFIRQ